MATAQSLASVGGPKELPPASYSGQQYVDSRGCVFLKAGYGGQTTWVPRVNAERKPLCGFPPTGAKVQIEVADAAPVAAPRVAAPQPSPTPPSRTAAVDPAIYTPAPYVAPVRKTAPAPLTGLTALRTTAPVPYAEAAPRRTYEVAKAGPGPGKIGCFTSAPVAEVVRLRNGGTAVVCTTGDGGLSGWRPPIYPAGSRVGVALTDPAHPHMPGSARKADPQPARLAAVDATTPPKGYKKAWTDDRLNPHRAQGTAQGQAAQDQIWTRDVPARLVAAEPRAKVRVTVSTKSAPNQPAKPAKGALVQIGTFGVPANAEAVVNRLAALGLPVAKGRTNTGGKSLQIVFAGPFATTAEAQAALSKARRAGFADAFLR